MTTPILQYSETPKRLMDWDTKRKYSDIPILRAAALLRLGDTEYSDTPILRSRAQSVDRRIGVSAYRRRDSSENKRVGLQPPITSDASHMCRKLDCRKMSGRLLCQHNDRSRHWNSGPCNQRTHTSKNQFQSHNSPTNSQLSKSGWYKTFPLQQQCPSTSQSPNKFSIVQDRIL